jgi:dolichyl-phosphate-mannose--protein O-mannosyl transferase
MLANLQSHDKSRGSKLLLLIIPLSLSAFIHLYNPVGFPAIHVDEGTYVRWALHYLAGLGPQERQLYDHPYFGQVFLAGVFKLIGYPDSLHPSANGSDNAAEKSIETLWLVPRVLMGLLAMVDTFLIYKISEYRYNNRKVAFIASILFAVMPITWLTKRIWLDNIRYLFFYRQYYLQSILIL